MHGFWAVGGLIEDCRASVAAILTENWVVLEMLRSVLLEKRTVDAKALGERLPLGAARLANEVASAPVRR